MQDLLVYKTIYTGLIYVTKLTANRHRRVVINYIIQCNQLQLKPTERNTVAEPMPLTNENGWLFTCIVIQDT